MTFADIATYHAHAPSYAGTDLSGPHGHEKKKHARYPTHNAQGQQVLPFDLLAVAVSTGGGMGPEGVAGIRRLRRAAPCEGAPGAGSVICGIGRAVVRWVTLAALDAAGIRDLGVGPPAQPGAP